MIGQLIKHARESMGLTQIQLCERLRTHHRRVSAWERGADGVTLESTTALARVLHVPQAELIAAVLRQWLERAAIEYESSVSRRKSANVNAGKALRRLRLEQGITLRALARSLQVSAPRVVNLEHGRKVVRPETAWWYAEALGIEHREPVRLALQDAVDRKCGSGFCVSVEHPGRAVSSTASSR